jgi:APA family basic amino acid/polyamine antiporter
VIALYLAVNVVYIYGVPVTEMKGALRVSEVATTALFGYQTSAWITALITVSILGALNVVTMIGPRIYYAMARDGVFFKRLARVHPAFGTPTSAILLQAIWACFLILTGTFGTLFTYVSVIITLFSALTVGLCHGAALEKAETKATLQTLGLSDCAYTLHPRSSGDCLGFARGEPLGLLERSHHC